MAYDEVSGKQRLLDDANKKLFDVNARTQREALAMQTELDAIANRFNNDKRSLEQNIKTIQANITPLQKDIAALQKKQTELQQRLKELQDDQTSMQNKHNDQLSRLQDYTTKLAGLQRDQLEAEKRARDAKTREIERLKNEASQIARGIGTLQADVARALAKQQQAMTANDNRSGTAGRQINGLRRIK